MTLLISESEVKQVLSIEAAIPVIEDVFRMAGTRNVENPPRTRMVLPKGALHFGAAALHSRNLVGFKLVAHFGKAGGARNFLYDMNTGELLAIVQASAITKMRTSAATAVAVKHLSAPGASVVGMYGTGRHAETQLQAICAVRRIRAAHVYSRTPEKREAFIRRMSERLEIDVVAMQAPEHVPREADIIVTITNSVEPVLRGDWIKRPALVVGAGATRWYAREIDATIIQKAKLIVVDEKQVAMTDGGSLLWANSHGLLRWDQVEELGDVVAGRVELPELSSGIIFFESHGVAIEDVAITAQAYELARARGLGREIAI